MRTLGTDRSPRAGRADLTWAFQADDWAILAALATGRHRSGLTEYFGEAAYRELCRLAVRAAGRRARSGRTRILIVPGMMGSRLATPARGAGAARGGRTKTSSRRAPSGGHSVLWIDPDRIGAGDLARLKLPGSRALRPIGVSLHAYARLALTLAIKGFEPEFFPYDWRLGLDALGDALAHRIAAAAEPLGLIAHSMGGLVARSALGRLDVRQVPRVILIGTPHAGCFDPVLALRGTHPFVRNLARLDRRHSAGWLARNVFNTFPGLYHLLPTGGRGGVDLLELRAWPEDAPRPDPALLRGVRAIRAGLAPPDRRMAAIVGVDRETVVALRRSIDGFAYESSTAGDGVVPVASARLPGLSNYYIAETHGRLACNPRVIDAVVDLLRQGSTERLPTRYTAPRRPRGRTDDATLRGGGSPQKIDWRTQSRAGRAALLEELDGVPRRSSGARP